MGVVHEAVPGDTAAVASAALPRDDGAKSGLMWRSGRPTPLPDPPAWVRRLTDLTVHGNGVEDRIAGIVHARIEDDGGVEFDYRVYRRGRLYRCASLDGRVHAIAGRDRYWIRRENGRIWSDPRDRFVGAPDDYEFGTARPVPDRWDGDDFTRPTGPPVEVTFLDRTAWQVELAPPAHKPHPMQMIIDAESGLLLRQANNALDIFHEWVALDTDAQLPDERFEYTETDRPASRYS
jgi:hypothetical protein